jgi:uncharacterized coiled-coil protein SlyX
MPFILPKAGEREYLTVNGITAIYIAENENGEAQLGTSRDLYQSLLALRRRERYAAIVAAYWLKAEADAALLCNAASEDTGSRMTVATLANRLEVAAERMNVALTDHETILAKVRSAVEYVDERLEEAQEAGQLRFFNRAFRQWRLQAKMHGRTMSYAEARARLRRSLYRQIAEGEPCAMVFPALEVLTA